MKEKENWEGESGRKGDEIQREGRESGGEKACREWNRLHSLFSSLTHHRPERLGVGPMYVC